MWKWLLLLLLLLLTAGLGALHFLVPAQIEAGQNTIVSHTPYVISPEARQLHGTLFIADLHADSLLWKRDLLHRSERGHVDVSRLRKGGVSLQVFAAVTASPAGQNYRSNTLERDNITLLALAQLWPPGTWWSRYARAAYQFRRFDEFVAASEGKLRAIRTQGDLEQLAIDRLGGPGQVGGLLAIEGGHALDGELENLDRLQAAGLRIIGLTHFFDNDLGGSLHGTSGAGLTDFGRAVVRRADELGLIIDLAHASPQVVRDVLELSTRPPMLSHGGIRSQCDQGRNLDDELMIQLAHKGGIVGIGFWDGAVCDTTPLGIVRSIQRAMELLGENHVALGSDWDGSTQVALDAGEVAILTATMLEQGFDERAIHKVMGDNVKRFLEQNLPAN